MATLQGDLVDAVTAGVSPISKDDSPVSVSNTPNGVSDPGLLKLAKKELADVDSSDVTRTDYLDEVISLPPKVEADIPHVDLNEADNHVTEDKAPESETTIAVAHSDDKEETEHPITDRKDNDTIEGLDFNAEAEQASAEPVPTEDRAEDEADNASTHHNAQLAGEESFAGAGNEERERESVVDEDDDVINVDASTKLTVDKPEVKDVSHDETLYEDELKLDAPEANVAASEPTVSSTDKPSELIAETATVVDENATEIEAQDVSETDVSRDIVDDLNASNDVVLPEPKEDSEEAHGPVFIATPVAPEDEASCDELSTEAGAVDETVKREEEPEVEIPAAIDEDLTSSTNVIEQASTSADTAQDITEDKVSESVVEDAKYSPVDTPEGESSVPVVEVITKGDNAAFSDLKKEEDPEVATADHVSKSEESELDIQQDEQPISVKTQDDLVSDVAQEPIVEAIEATTEEVVPTVESVAEEREEDHIATESDDAVVESAADSHENAVPPVESASEEHTKESVPTVALEESKEEASTVVESATEEPKEEVICVEDEGIAAEVEDVVSPEEPTEQSIPVVETTSEEVCTEDELKAELAVASQDEEVKEPQVPAHVENAAVEPTIEEEVIPADPPSIEQSVAAVTEVVTEQSEEEHAPIVDSIDDKSAEELTVVTGEEGTVELQEETLPVDELAIVDPIKETVHEEDATAMPHGDVELTEVGADVEKSAEESISADVSDAVEVSGAPNVNTVIGSAPVEPCESSETAAPTIDSTTEESIEEATPTKDDGDVKSILGEVKEEAALAVDTASEGPVEDITNPVSEESKEEAAPAVESTSSELVDDAANPAADETRTGLADDKEEQAPAEVEGAFDEKPVAEAASEHAIEGTVERAIPAHEVDLESSHEQVPVVDSIPADPTEGVTPPTAEAVVEPTVEESTKEVAEESQDATPLVDSSAEDTSEDFVHSNVGEVASAIVEPTEEAALVAEPIAEESRDATPLASSSVQDTTEDLVHSNVEDEVESSIEQPTKEAVSAAEPIAEESSVEEIKEDFAHTNVEGEVESSVDEPTEAAALAVEPITEDEVESAIDETTERGALVVQPVAEESKDAITLVDSSAEDTKEDVVRANVEDEVESVVVEEPIEEVVLADEPAVVESAGEAVSNDLDNVEPAFGEPREGMSTAEPATSELTKENVSDAESQVEIATSGDPVPLVGSATYGTVSAEDELATERAFDDSSEPASSTEPHMVLAKEIAEPSVEEFAAKDEVTESEIAAVQSATEEHIDQSASADADSVKAASVPEEEVISATYSVPAEPSDESQDQGADVEVSNDVLMPEAEVSVETALDIEEAIPVTESAAVEVVKETASSPNDREEAPLVSEVESVDTADELIAAGIKGSVGPTGEAVEEIGDVAEAEESRGSTFEQPKEEIPAEVVSAAEVSSDEGVPAVEASAVDVEEQAPANVESETQEDAVEGVREEQPAIAVEVSSAEGVPIVESSMEYVEGQISAEGEVDNESQDAAEGVIEEQLANAVEVSSGEGVPTVESSAEHDDAAEEVGEELPASEKPEEELVSTLKVEPIQAHESESAEESVLPASEHPVEVETASLFADKPTIAINTDVVDSAEIDTPSLITDATSAAGSSARPWTPSFQVTTVGRSISPVPEVEIADAQTEDLSVPVFTTSDGTKYEDITEKTSTDVSDVGANLIAPRPWTPSYAVHSQGSPLLAAVGVDVDDGAVRDEDIPDVSEIEFAENPEQPVAHTTNAVETVSRESAPQDSSAIVTSDAVEEEAPAKESIEVPQEREILKALPEAVSGPSIVEPVPETAEEHSSGINTLERGIDDKVSSNAADEVCQSESAQVQEHASIWVPSYSVSRQGSPHPTSQELPVSAAEDENSPTQENVEHAETFTTVVEPSEVPEVIAVDEHTTVHATEAAEPSEVLEIVAEEKNAPALEAIQSTESPAPVIEASEVPELADANEVPALDELESTRSLDSDANKEQLTSTSWVPSYSVSRQGSPLPEVRSLGTSEKENEPAVAPAESFTTNDESSNANEIIERSTTPAVIVTPEDKLAPAEESLPERPWTPSYSVISQGPVSPAKSSAILENPAEIGVKPTDIQVEVASTDVAVPVDIAKANIIEGVPQDDITKDQTPFPQSPEIAMESSISTLPPVDENAVSDATSSVAESTPTVRKRLESTTSSRFFPGGWFSPSPKVPHEGRTSLEVAQGEFIPSKAVPADDVSDIVPDSASESSTAPDDNATEADDEKKRGRWCVIM